MLLLKHAALKTQLRNVKSFYAYRRHSTTILCAAQDIVVYIVFNSITLWLNRSSTRNHDQILLTSASILEYILELAATALSEVSIRPNEIEARNFYP